MYIYVRRAVTMCRTIKKVVKTKKVKKKIRLDKTEQAWSTICRQFDVCVLLFTCRTCAFVDVMKHSVVSYVAFEIHNEKKICA